MVFSVLLLNLSDLFAFVLHLKFFFLFNNKVAGYAVGGGHVLHMVCDLTIAADNAIFGQTGPKVSCSTRINALIFDRNLFLIIKESEPICHLMSKRWEALMLVMEVQLCQDW